MNNAYSQEGTHTQKSKTSSRTYLMYYLHSFVFHCVKKGKVTSPSTVVLFPVLVLVLVLLAREYLPGLCFRIWFTRGSRASAVPRPSRRTRGPILDRQIPREEQQSTVQWQNIYALLIHGVMNAVPVLSYDNPLKILKMVEFWRFQLSTWGFWHEESDFQVKIEHSVHLDGQN